MRLITRECDYGIIALMSMAKREGTTVSAAVLAKELGIPGAFLRRILQRLGSQGQILSRKGIGGGFELAKRPGDILVGDILTALQGPMHLNDCDVRKAICARHSRCILRRKLKEIEERLLAGLMALSIASLADEGAGCPVKGR